MKLSKSQSHYVKAVYELSAGDKGVRVIDIAERLSLSKASVSFAMTKLARLGLVRKDSDRHVYLTDDGEWEAVRLLDKYEVIRHFLTGVLHVKDKVAEHDACAIEHVVSVETLCAICKFSGSVSSTSPCPLHCSVSSGEADRKNSRTRE